MSYQVFNYDWLEDLINKEILENVEVLRSSYLSNKYKIDLRDIHNVLVDMASASKLNKSYQVLCSGEKQNFDVDLEVDDPSQIPMYAVTCHVCGDRYVPSEEYVLVYFTPTGEYKSFLTTKAGSDAG